MQEGGVVTMTRCSTTSSMNSKQSMGFNKFRINAKLRKKQKPSSDHLTNPTVTSCFRRALSQDGLSRNRLMALQNRRTTPVLTNSRVTTKPMNNAQQRGGKHTKRNTETCRVNTHKCSEFIAKWEDRARH